MTAILSRAAAMATVPGASRRTHRDRRGPPPPTPRPVARHRMDGLPKRAFVPSTVIRDLGSVKQHVARDAARQLRARRPASKRFSSLRGPASRHDPAKVLHLRGTERGRGGGGVPKRGQESQLRRGQRSRGSFFSSDGEPLITPISWRGHLSIRKKGEEPAGVPHRQRVVGLFTSCPRSLGHRAPLIGWPTGPPTTVFLWILSRSDEGRKKQNGVRALATGDTYGQEALSNVFFGRES